jgi:hypothetical protein
VLDIKFENLSNQISSSSAAFSQMTEEQIKSALDSIPITDNMLVVALSPTKAAARVITLISEAAKLKGFGETVSPIASIDVPSKMASGLRSNLAASSADPQSSPSINRIDYQSIEERIKKFQSTVFVSHVGFEPLFGFSGAPTTLLRSMFPEKMNEAFYSRKGNLPAPGEQGEPLKIALSTAQDILDSTAGATTTTTAIEIVTTNGTAGIGGIHIGPTIQEAFSKAIDQLKSIGTTEADPVRSVVVSAGSDPGTHTTLSNALYSLWNTVHLVRDGGSAVLLAECREGVGGGALQALVEGRIKQEQVQAITATTAGAAQQNYTDGLEHLLYIQEVKQRCELGLVSSLPRYYAGTKLGFTPYAGAKDAYEKLLARNGKGHKALVISDADIIYVRPRV